MAGKQEPLATTKAAQRPTITLPPRPPAESLFTGGGLSPGPMTLVSSFFSPDAGSYLDSNFNSFSQLLAGAMASPRLQLYADFSYPVGGTDSNGGGDSGNSDNKSGDSSGGLGFKQSRPMSLALGARSPMFTVPPGLSPSGLFSPGFFSPQSPFGMSHQQALAQVTAQAALVAQTQMHMQAQAQPQYPSAASTEVVTHPPSLPHEEASQQQLPSTSDSQSSVIEPTDFSQSDRRNQLPLVVDKPSDDGYNWRKYGQKPIKGSEYPRSYYKCTYPSCPVKKKVERSNEGQITEIIYKGQHNHDKPPPNKRAREAGDASGSSQPEARSRAQAADANNLVPVQSTYGRDWESAQFDPSEQHESSESEEDGDALARTEDVYIHEPNPKRRQFFFTACLSYLPFQAIIKLFSTSFANCRSIEVEQPEAPIPHKTITEPKIIVQTRSEVDLLDDGYRWRKYGQKVVKGNPHPRSYYKCTSAGCNVRKHVERAAADPKAVITTYEGKHNHDVPGARNSGNNNALQSRPPKVVAQKDSLLNETDYGSNDQRPILLQLKEEKIAV